MLGLFRSVASELGNLIPHTLRLSLLLRAPARTRASDRLATARNRILAGMLTGGVDSPISGLVSGRDLASTDLAI